MAKDPTIDTVLRLDPAEVSDADLLTVLLVGGTGRRDPRQVALQMLADAGGDIGQLTRPDVLSRADLAPIAEARLRVIREVHRRASLRQAIVDRSPIRNPKDAAAYLRPLVGDDVEHVAVLYLDRKKNVIRVNRSTVGSEAHSIFDVRGLLSAALAVRASAIIVAHNHPSGQAEFSIEDIRVTRALQAAAKTLGVDVVDHLLFAGPQVVSMAEVGLLPSP